VSLVAVTRPVESTQSAVPGASHNVPRGFAASSKKDDILKYISFGASPRASIALLLCSKVFALFDGRNYVLPDDVKKAALPVLRHRLLLSYEAQADDVTADGIITKILSALPVP
jgi:MoxR-like ATPase